MSDSVEIDAPRGHCAGCFKVLDLAPAAPGYVHICRDSYVFGEAMRRAIEAEVACIALPGKDSTNPPRVVDE